MTEEEKLMAEAVEVLEGVTPGPWTEHDKGKHPSPYVCGATESYEHGEDQPVVAYVVGMNDAANRRFIAWCREGVPALLARIAAQEAQMAEWQASQHYRYIGADGQPVLARDLEARAEAAEAVLAAERAKVAKLVEALTNLPAVYAHQINTGVREVYDPLQRFYTMESVLAAITEARE